MRKVMARVQKGSSWVSLCQTALHDAALFDVDRLTRRLSNGSGGLKLGLGYMLPGDPGRLRIPVHSWSSWGQIGRVRSGPVQGTSGPVLEVPLCLLSEL